MARTRAWNAAAVLTGLSALLAGCAFTIDGDQLDTVLTGAPRSPTDVAQGWDVTLRELAVLQGSDGTPWLSIDRGDFVKLQSLLDPARSQVFFPRVARFSHTPARSVCFVERPQASADGESEVAPIRLHHPGETVSPSFLAPYSTAGMSRTLCGERTMVYWQDTSKNEHIDVVRRVDGPPYARHLKLPWPMGANPAWDQGPLLLSADARESVLLIVDGEYHMIAHHLDTGVSVDLGVMYWGSVLPEALTAADGPDESLELLRDSLFFIDLDGYVLRYAISRRAVQPLGYRLSPDGYVVGLDPQRGAILTCDWDGLRSITIRDTEWERTGKARPREQRVLDPTRCLAAAPELTVRRGFINYFTDGDIRSARLDGTQPPVPLTSRDTQVVWSLCRGENRAAAAYSMDPPERYGKGVGDAWLGGWRFAEHAREVRLTPDCEQLHWKEYAANLRKLGELRAAPLSAPGATPLRLARNVSWYQELPDGRLLAASDAAVIDPSNKLVLIDKERRTADWLLSGVTAVTGAVSLGPLFKGRLPAGASLDDAPGEPAPDSPLAALGRSVLLEYDSPERTGMRRVLMLTLPPRERAP